MENGKFEIGEDEDNEEDEVGDTTSNSPVMSDWEDSDLERCAEHHNKGSGGCFWDDDEAELSQFVCKLYESMFREGASVEAALQHALASSHKRLRYSCHLPTTR